MRRALLCSALLWTTACGADLGLLGGVQTNTGNPVAAGRLAFASKIGLPINENGFLVGTAIENRAEKDVGATWNGGVMAGWGWGPAAIDGRYGFEAYGEFGTPLQSTLFSHGDLYAGAAVAVPIRIGARRHVDDLNDATWVLRRRYEFVPLLRTRMQYDPSLGGKQVRFDVSLGFTFRLRVFTDLF